jgi:glyoxylase-like metal-dependent hydrolase (beta-lactamase superfamily II)
MEVAPGVRWIRMGLPFALDHINLWLLADASTGARAGPWWTAASPTTSPKRQWEQIFATQLDGMPILRVIVTHMHPDHIGLAHWLCARWSAPLWISATDYNAARLGSQIHHRLWRRGSGRFFCFARPDRPRCGGKNPRPHQLLPEHGARCATQLRRLQEGDSVRIGGRDWRCISRLRPCARAHRLVLRRAESADQRRHDAAAHFHQRERVRRGARVQRAGAVPDSIDRFKSLPQDTLVLPSHGKPFQGLHTRIQQLHDHHRDRLAEVMEAVRPKPALCGRYFAHHVPPSVGSAPDHIRHGRGGGALACLVVPRQCATPVWRRRHLPLHNPGHYKPGNTSALSWLRSSA